jgi:predicted DNA-binding transcriptional regulator YafY
MGKNIETKQNLRHLTSKEIQQAHDERKEIKAGLLNERCIEILQILRGAPEHPETKYNSIYFENHFKVSNITILRDIKTLKDLDLIETKHQQYCIKPDVEQIYSSETMHNLAIVACVKGLLQQYKNTPLFKSVQNLIYFLEPKVAKNDELFTSSRITVPPQMEFNVNIDNWDKVFRAIQLNHKITFRYTGPYTDSKSVRTVLPYQLLLDNGTVYLFAHSEYHDVDILYTLNRMADITVTNESFELPKDFDFASRCGGGRLGAFKGDKIQKYKIEFFDYARTWIKEHKWADDQVFEETENSTIITFTSTQWHSVLQLVLQWGSQARPLAPKKLVDDWKKEITAMTELSK